MDAQFWLERWKEKRIGFHLEQVNPHLVEHLSKLKLVQGDKVFVPLCGKSLDLPYLAQNGYEVTGLELSAKAIAEFFVENHLSFEILPTPLGPLWVSKRIKIFQIDLFDLNPKNAREYLGEFDAIWDRASYIALSPGQRSPYLSILMSILKQDGHYLISALEHKGRDPEGPPFHVDSQDFIEMMKNQFNFNFQIVGKVSAPASQPEWASQGIDLHTWVAIGSTS